MEVSPDSIVIYAREPIVLNATLLFTWITMGLLVGLSGWVTRQLSVRPQLPPWQNGLEMVVDGICNQIREITQQDPEPYLFGSDHGLCGSFNEQIVTYALEQLQYRQIPRDRCLVATVGARLVPHLETAHQPIQTTFSLPSSPAGSLQLIQTLLLSIEQWCFRQHSDPITSTSGEMMEIPHPSVEHILLFYNQHRSTTAYQPVSLQLLPLDRAWLYQLEQRPWNSSAQPSLSMNWEPLFSRLIRQYLFLSLYRATVESLASENAARLAAMQAAEKNIEERLTDLNTEYRQQRQNAITEELLDYEF
jgi:F-type H+-transporting ATPase subunit gamma